MNEHIGTPEQYDAGWNAILSNFHSPDERHSSWWINPDEMLEAVATALGVKFPPM